MVSKLKQKKRSLTPPKQEVNEEWNSIKRCIKEGFDKELGKRKCKLKRKEQIMDEILDRC